MPAALRSRLAFIALLGAFLIPLGLSSLRGLGHVLTCDQSAETPFTIEIDELGRAQIQSSTKIDQSTLHGLCGGLFLDMRAAGEGQGKVRFAVAIRNQTEFPWRGTVKLSVRGGAVTTLPLGIGEIGPGGTGQDTVEFTLPPGSHELDGSLLIGP